jgi:1-acyl-sn-glycerol-3-phosphate acyltransferase
LTVHAQKRADAEVSPSRHKHDRFDSKFQAAARFVAQRAILRPVVWKTLVTVTVRGQENVKDITGGYVVVANHSSHLDTPLIMGGLPRKLVRYLAAGAAADYFFDVWWRRGLTALFFNAFPVQRTAGGIRSISAKSLLERGIPLLVFPEGTRSKDGNFGQFKPGAAALASSCNVPCIPVALVGVYIAHPRGTNWPKRGRLPVGVVIGEPMHALPGENPVDFTARIKAEITRLRDINTADILGPQRSSKGAKK